MSRRSLSWFLAVLFTLGLSAGRAAAENEGQPDLDKAMQLKISAASSSDLSEVVELCESALQKGLDAAAAGDAKALLAATLVQRAMIRAQAGRLDTALDDLNKSIDADPKNPSSYEMKALILAKESKYDEALAALDKGSEVAPEAVGFPVQKARVYIARGALKEALREADKAAAMEPENLAVLLLRGAIHQAMGDRQKALAEVDKVLKLKPELTEAARTRAVLLSELGKYDQASAELEKLRKASPKDPVTLLLLSRVYSEQKKHDKAVEALDALVAEYPGEWMAYRGRADAQLGRGQRAAAIRDYDKAMQLQPKEVGILNNLAWVLATAPEKDLRDGKRAVVLANEACKLTNFEQAHILSTLAAGHAETGDFEEAVKWASKAVEIGSKEHGEQLQKELESYKARKPWRESLPEDEKKPAKKK